MGKEIDILDISDGELDESSTTEKLSVVQQEGSRKMKRKGVKKWWQLEIITIRELN